MQEPQLLDCGLRHRLSCSSFDVTPLLGLLTHFLGRWSYLSNYKGFLFLSQALRAAWRQRALRGSQAWLLSPAPTQTGLPELRSQFSVSAHNPPWTSRPLCVLHTPLPLPPGHEVSLQVPFTCLTPLHSSGLSSPPISRKTFLYPPIPSRLASPTLVTGQSVTSLNFMGFPTAGSPAPWRLAHSKSFQECSWRRDPSRVRSEDGTDNGHSPWRVYYSAFPFF